MQVAMGSYFIRPYVFEYWIIVSDMKYFVIWLILVCIMLPAQAQDARTILKMVDDNMSSTNRKFSSTMTIHGKRSSRTVESVSYAVGIEKSFTEYLAPASDKGTKMLKLGNQLWIFSPATDRIIQISGHLLRQSVMGSDLSYEDMMDDRKLSDVYEARIIGKEALNDRPVILLELVAKVTDVAYHSQKMWVDCERYVPLKQELYAKSGQLLKQMELKDVQKVQGRWFPTIVVYKDVLKEGKGTEFRISKIEFDVEIPAHLFSKASLKK
jgi:outer membrane lipoprotein-sorting protein